jgi:hypothetical protein
MEAESLPMTYDETAEIEKASPSDTIKVSNNRSLFFYVDLATKFLLTHDTVEVSGLGGGTFSCKELLTQ